MAKPYALVNNVYTTVSVEFVHGTDNHIHGTDLALFPAGGGYFRACTGDSDADAYAEYEYTGKSGDTLTGLTPGTLGNVQSGAAYTFPVGSKIQRIIAAEEITDLRTDLDAKVSNATHTGDVTGSGALAIGANKVTLAMLATQAAETLLANATSGAAVPTAVALAEQTVLGRITGGHVVGLTASQLKTLIATALADLVAIATDTVVANVTAGSAAPAALAVGEQTILGRITGGHIAALTAAQAKTLLAYVLGDLAAVAADTVAANATGGSAALTAVALAEQTILGRITGGHVVGLTAAQVKTLIAIVAADLPTVMTPSALNYSTALAADHTFWGDYITENVGENVNFGELLYFDCSEVEWKRADYNVVGTMPCMGISVTNGQVTNGNPCNILLRGGVRHDAWSWQIDDVLKILYCGATGAMQVTPVSGTGDYSQAVAIMKTATTIHFRPSLAMAKVT